MCNFVEVNWYLCEYVGCKLEMKDGNNWCFSDDVYLGVIYIFELICVDGM